MKQKIRKWVVGIAGGIMLFTGLIAVVILNPSLLYADKTEYKNFTVYHNSPLDDSFHTILDNSTKLVKASEIYDPMLKIDICLNDGSFYPQLIKLFQNPGFGFGFYNKVVIMGKINSDVNYSELNGYKWNLTELLAHEEIHCFQFNKLGIWKSNPAANYPQWKWEGYNEYIARQNQNISDLSKNIEKLINTENIDRYGWQVNFDDSTVTGRDYYKWMLLIQFCFEIKNMTYVQILQSRLNELSIRNEMMNWYKRKNH